MIIKYDDGGVEKSLEILADSFAELRPVMAEFTGWMRKQIDQVFATESGGSWPERSEGAQLRTEKQAAARIEKIERNRYNSLRGALRSERRRAERRLAKTSPTDSKLTERRRKSVARYETQQAELERLVSGGAKDGKGFKRLYERAGRREASAEAKIEAVKDGRLLGRIANSFVIEFDKTHWQMASRIPWAGVHNEGGTVHNGATIRARVFLEWTPERLQKFVELANKYVLERAAKAPKSESV